MIKRIKELKRITLILAGLVLLYFIIMAITAYLIYGKGSYGQYASKASRFFSLPVMTINFHPISYASYFHRELDFTVRSLNDLHKDDSENNGKPYLSTEAGKKDLAAKQAQALNQIIKEEFIRQYSRRHRISLPKGYLDGQYEKLVSENGGQKAWDDSLKNDLGWSSNQFKEVLKLELLREQINKSFCDQDDAVAKKQADKILEQVKQPKADFAALAKQYSEDQATAVNGGLYGVVDRKTKTLDNSSDLVDESILGFIERAKTGDTELVRACNGYEIIKLGQKDDNKATVHLILIRTLNFDDLEQEFRVKSSTALYAKGFKFNQQTGSVEPK